MKLRLGCHEISSLFSLMLLCMCVPNATFFLPKIFENNQMRRYYFLLLCDKYQTRYQHYSVVFFESCCDFADVQTKEFASPDVAGQTEQVMKNLGAILTAAGSSYNKVVKTTILLEDMSDFGIVNEIYGKYFPSEPPARATFAVKGLPLGAKVEIEAIALQ